MLTIHQINTFQRIFSLNFTDPFDVQRRNHTVSITLFNFTAFPLYSRGLAIGSSQNHNDCDGGEFFFSQGYDIAYGANDTFAINVTITFQEPSGTALYNGRRVRILSPPLVNYFLPFIGTTATNKSLLFTW